MYSGQFFDDDIRLSAQLTHWQFCRRYSMYICLHSVNK